MITARLKLKRSSGFTLDVDIALEPRVTALYGPSGSGKTTILRLIAGLERPGPNDIIDVASDNETWQSGTTYLPSHKRQVGVVFQQPQLFPHLTVHGNLDYALKRAGGKPAAAFDQVCDWLDLGPLLNQYPHELSGGQAQRVAIGRVLMSRVQCILMDEPLGSVDEATKARILPYLDRLHRELRIPIAYVSHSLFEVNYLADHVYMINDGRVVAAGSVFETSSSLAFNRDQGEEVATVIECETVAFDDTWQLAELRLGDSPLFLTTSRIEPGRKLRVRVPARDVSIARSKPVDTSILNVLPATIDEISTSGASALIRLQLGRQYLLARITRKSLDTLGLEQGQAVFAQIKGVALLTDHD